MANCPETDEIPRGTTEKLLPCHLQRNQRRGRRTSKLRKSMIAVLEPGVGCGYELLAGTRKALMKPDVR
jgi:hypothetical protein